MRTSVWGFIVVSGSFLGSIVGCGDERVNVQGRVMLEGSPLESGSISFLPADGKGNSAGARIKNGAYLATEVLPGKKLVQITAVRKTGKRVPVAPPMPAGVFVDEIVPVQVPTRDADVLAGKENHLSFELP